MYNRYDNINKFITDIDKLKMDKYGTVYISEEDDYDISVCLDEQMERFEELKWEKEGILSDWDFLQAATDFLQMPIGEALISDNCLIRIFAILDRRAGKRTIKQIQDSEKYKTYPEWVQQFYKLRFES